MTPIARDLVSAYEPIIRAVHNAVDLSGTVYDAQAFIDDLIKLSKPRPASSAKDTPPAGPPSIEDFIALLEKHQSSTHRFLHQVVKNSPELREKYRAFAHHIAAEFRSEAPPSTSANVEKSASVSPQAHALLTRLFNELQSSDRKTVRSELAAHAEYLASLSASSTARIHALLSTSTSSSSPIPSSKSPPLGPGIYLARWQSLLDATALTPTSPNGSIRHGNSPEAISASRRDTDGEQKGGESQNAKGAAEAAEHEASRAPDVRRTVALLGQRWWEVLREWKAGEKEGGKEAGGD